MRDGQMDLVDRSQIRGCSRVKTTAAAATVDGICRLCIEDRVDELLTASAL
jgi:hypothetical protein